MPLAVTHVLTSIILVDIYRDFFARHRKFFTMHTLIVAGIGGLLPDIDVPLRIVLGWLGIEAPNIFQHGGITHTPFFALLLLIPGLALWKMERHKQAVYFFVLFFGSFLHIILDYVLGGGAYEGIMWLFPLSLEQWKLHLLFKLGGDVPAALDAVMLLGWLWYAQTRDRIKDFI